MFTFSDINKKGAGDLTRYNGVIKHYDERGNSAIIGVKTDRYGIGNEKRTINSYFNKEQPKGYKMPKSDRGVYAQDLHHDLGVSYNNYYTNKSAINRAGYTENKNFRITDSKGKAKINIGNKWS